MENKMIMKHKGIAPQIHESAFIAPGACVIGDVKIGEGSSIWFNSIVRGDLQPISIGKYANIQEGTSVHVMCDCPLEIGDYVTIGHNATIHCKKIGNNSLIGMGAVLLGYSEIGENCVIAAGTVLTEGFIVPSNAMVMGVPGRIVREMTEEESAALHQSAINYCKIAQDYMK